MWEWLTRYPSGRIEDVGTLYEKDLEDQDVAEYDYIIVGGLF
jgi:ABC-type enterochelin transport system substrate-binding protein